VTKARRRLEMWRPSPRILVKIIQGSKKSLFQTETKLVTVTNPIRGDKVKRRYLLYMAPHTDYQNGVHGVAGPPPAESVVPDEAFEVGEPARDRGERPSWLGRRGAHLKYTRPLTTKYSSSKFTKITGWIASVQVRAHLHLFEVKPVPWHSTEERRAAFFVFCLAFRLDIFQAV